MTHEELEKLIKQDSLKARELCSTCIVRVFEILGQLQAILDTLRAISVPELSSYTKISAAKSIEETPSKPLPQQTQSQQIAQPVKKKTESLTDLAMTLARNLELQQKK